MAFLLITPFPAFADKEARLEPVSSEVFKENRSGKMWRTTLSTRLKDSDQVAAFLSELNSGEFSDWRLPTKKELYDLTSIFDLKENGPVKIRVEGKYWMQDDKGAPFAGAWEIGDQCGPSRTFYKGRAGYIRAIRP